MNTTTIRPVQARRRSEQVQTRRPVSEELGADLQRLERHQRAVEDRRRAEELARLREIQGFD